MQLHRLGAKESIQRIEDANFKAAQSCKGTHFRARASTQRSIPVQSLGKSLGKALKDLKSFAAAVHGKWRSHARWWPPAKESVDGLGAVVHAQ